MPDELSVVDNPVADSTRFDLEAAEGKGEDEVTASVGPTVDVVLLERVRFAFGLYRPPRKGTPFQRVWPYVCFTILMYCVSQLVLFA